MITSAPTSLVLSGATCLLYQTPLLYVWLRGEDVLYVGMSMGGVSRPLGRSHERITAIEPDDTLEFLFRPYSCTMGLLSEEARLIARLKPRLNGKVDPNHIQALKAHPGDCPPSGEHVQLGREAAAAVRRAREERAEAVRREDKEREEAEVAQFRAPVLTAREAAERLAVSMPTIERLLRRGAIPSIQVAGTRTRRIRESDIDQIVRFGFVETGK